MHIVCARTGFSTPEALTTKPSRTARIVFSRLFETNYTDKLGHLGIVKFNLLTKDIKLPTIALGGIRKKNLNKLKLVRSNSFAILSELKNNRANIIKKLL